MALLGFSPVAAQAASGFPIGQQQTVNEPFVWGQGGQRLTPEDIAMRERLAMQQRQAGADFSPVGSVWEGLGRVAQGVMGGLGERDARRATEANLAESDALLQAILSGDQPVEGGPDPLLAAMGNPYVSDQVRDIASMQYQMQNPPAPKPTEFERVLMESGIQRGSPEWVQAMQTKAANTLDPFTNLVVGGNSITGRQSLVQQALAQRGGGPVSGAAQTTPPPEAIAELRSNPSTASQFDEIFGAGTAARILGNGGQSASNPSATFPGSFRGLEGETVTSTYRDPAKNRSVGGVGNSFHMRRDAQGNPMARDSVPPPGMSMAAYANELRARNPWADVINEGDHVHMEPKG